MKIEVWADIICPWCGLGDHRLNEAISRFDHPDEVEVVHRSFQLDPSFPADTVLSSAEMLKAKGMDESAIRGSMARIEEMAAAEGLTPYRVRDNLVGNTSLAHELLAFATDQGRHSEAWATMFRVYFGEGRSVFDLKSVTEIAITDLGLDADEAVEALTSRRFRPQVQADQAEGQQLGARGVPFFVFDRTYGVSGAQPADQLLAVIQRAHEQAA